MPAAIIGAVVAAGSAAYSIAQQEKAKKRAAKAAAALDKQPVYKPSEYNKRILADALVSKNAINPAIINAQRQAQVQAAGQAAQAARNSPSGAVNLAVGNMAQQNYLNSLPSILAAQTAFNQQNKGQYYNALMNMTEDERFRYMQDKERNMNRFNFELGQAGAANQGAYQGINAGASILSNPELWRALQGLVGTNAPTASYIQPMSAIQPTITNYQPQITTAGLYR